MHGPQSRPGDSEIDRSQDQYDAEDMRWVTGFVALIGVWIAISPLLYSPTAVASWNNGLVGAGIAILASSGFFVVWEREATHVAAASLVALLGIWTLVSPLLVPFGDPGLLWSTVGAGGLVGLVAGYQAYVIGSGTVFGRPART